MASTASFWPRLPAALLFLPAALVSAQEAACYYGAGPDYRVAPSAGVVPCDNTQTSACCRLGDLCLEGNACFNWETSDTYQLGCTDETYKDAACPFKCGFNPALSPWVGLEYCPSYGDINETWNCQAPENCACEWRATYELLSLPPRPCTAMGSLARVALYATESLAAYLSLPSSSGGSTGYYSPGGGTTVVAGYTPSSIGPTGTISQAQEIVQYAPRATPMPPASSQAARLLDGSLPPIPSTPTNTSPTGNVLGSSSSAPHGHSATGSSSSSSASSSTAAHGKGSSGGSGNGGNGGGSSGTTNDGSNNGSGGLTTGAKVGLGVGIAGGVCLIAAIVLVFFFLRKRKQKEIQAATIYNDEKSDPAAYYDPYNRGANVHEAPYTPQEEATARKRNSPHGIIAELDSGQPIHEMDSTSESTANSPAVHATS